MKNLLIVTLFALLIGCSKDDPDPTPAQQQVDNSPCGTKENGFPITDYDGPSAVGINMAPNNLSVIFYIEEKNDTGQPTRWTRVSKDKFWLEQPNTHYGFGVKLFEPGKTYRAGLKTCDGSTTQTIYNILVIYAGPTPDKNLTVDSNLTIGKLYEFTIPK